MSGHWPLALALTLLACGSDDTEPATGTGGSTSTGGTSSGGSAGTGSGGTAGGGGAAGAAGSRVACSPSGPIVLDDGETTLSDLCITSDDKGVEGGNATQVTKVSLTNVSIDSVNYGVYLGDCQEAVFDHVDITTQEDGGDSYSVRGAISKLTSSSSTYRAGIKAFRIYNLTNGSSTNDTFLGGRLMLGGGAASEWENPLAFESFTFDGAYIQVESIEIYDATHHVTFDGVDFAGTGHISVQFGAHDLAFLTSQNLPEIRYYDATGTQYDPSASELASRNIVFSN